MSIFDSISDPNARNGVVSKVNTAVRLKHEQDVLKEDIKAIAEELKEDLGIKPADFNKLVRAVYKNDLMEQQRTLAAIEADLQVIAENS